MGPGSARLAAGAISTIASVVVLSLAGAPSRVEASPLVVKVEGVRETAGRVRAELCTAATFLTDACEFSADAPAVAGEAVVTFQDVPPGHYAVQLFHDVRGDGRLRRGAFGVPLEGVGFSNDAPIGLSGPQFVRAAFAHGDDGQAVRVTLRFLAPSVLR